MIVAHGSLLRGRSVAVGTRSGPVVAEQARFVGLHRRAHSASPSLEGFGDADAPIGGRAF
jgi:hypothetical protein